MKKLLQLILYFFSIGVITAQQLTFQWVKGMGGASADIARASAIDASGNVYTIGNYNGVCDFDPGAGTSNLTPIGSFDVFISKLDASGNFVWAKSVGNFSNDFGNAIFVDAAANIYVTGSFQGQVDFNPGVGIDALTAVGSDDIFVLKLDAAGNFLWVRQLGGASSDNGWSVKVDALGNVYTAGSFQGTADFDPGAGTTNLTSAGSDDVFVSKLDALGNFVWAKNMGGTAFDGSKSMVVDATGNVYTTGSFQSTSDFDPSAGTFNLTSVAAEDIFISKLDASGNFVWAKSLGGVSADNGYGMALDASGNVFVTGSFQGTVDFDPGASAVNVSSLGVYDAFVLKLDAAGNFAWVKNVGGGSASAYGFAITLDVANSIYFTGFYDYTVDFDPGAATVNLNCTGVKDGFITKLDASGNFAWAINWGGIGDDAARSISVDASGNVYTSGFFQNTSDFYPGGLAPLTSAGSYDCYVHKMSQLGVGIAEVNNQNTIRVYPNPSNGYFAIELGSNAQVIICNTLGEVILNEVFDNGVQYIDIRNNETGVYFVRVISDGTEMVAKFVKE